MTAQELIDGALRAIGVIASGESPNPEESADSLVTLNDLLASWSALGLPIYEIIRDATPLTGVESYVLTTRPVRIKSGSVVAANGVAQPVEIVSAERWAGITDRTRTGVYADVLFCDFGLAVCTVRLSPKPSTGTLELWVYRALASVGALSTSFSLPPGYLRALRLNLAVELASEFGRPVSESLTATAQEAKSAITNLNSFVLGEQTAPPAGAAQ